MQTVSDILRTKGDTVVAVSPHDTVLHALGVMAEHEVGAVLVLNFFEELNRLVPK